MSSSPRAALGVLITCAAATSAQALAADAPTAAPAVQQIDQDWKDTARSRTLPIRLYLPDLPPQQKLPVIFVSHGLGGSRNALAYACEAWAQAGYTVVALQHPGSDTSVWQNVAPWDAWQAIRRAASPEQFILRCGDVRFAIDEVTRRNASDAMLKGRIDLDRIGVAGHSFGALTVQGVIGQRYEPRFGKLSFKDERIKAAVVMSPGIEGSAEFGVAFRDVSVPVFHFTGTADETPGLSPIRAEQRRVPFDHMTRSDQYLIIFRGGDHVVFAGEGPLGGSQYERIQAAVKVASTKFWDAKLRGDADAGEWLEQSLRGTLARGDVYEHKAPSK